jgi:putative endonuclease
VSRASGLSSENQAAEWLIERGFRILERNFTVKGGEIDLVCDDAGTLVFVEVRARTSNDYGTPVETISAAKRRRIILAAKLYLLTRKIDERACRFDVVAIEDGQVTHLPDAFDAG